MPAESNAPFVMYGAREVIEAGVTHIAEQVSAIEKAVDENPALAFDLARTLIESTCRTILTERKLPFSENDDLPRLFKLTTTQLPLLPASASDAVETRESLARTLSGLNTAVHGICELRNQCGFASHGPGTPRPSMESVQALLAVGAADTIVGFLHRVHRQDRTPPPPSRTLYDDNPEFNSSVDELHEMVKIYTEEFLPSRVLFELAPEPYRLYLSEFDSSGEANDPESSGGGAAAAAS